MANQLCIVFVCQAGELELKGMMLAASLRQNGLLVDVDLVAAVPHPSMWGELCHETSELLTEMNVRQVIIDSPFGKEYPIGNKLHAIGVKTDAPVTVFVDSDILCLSAIENHHLITSCLRAKPADLNTYAGGVDQWQQAYALAGLPLPTEKVLSTTSQELMLPYFNAGLVSVRNGPEFSKTWLSVAKQIDACEIIKNKRPWLDQIALPVAAKAMGYKFEVLNEEFNYPAHLQRLQAQNLPKLCHYHSPDIIAQEPALCSLVAQLCERFSGLKTLLLKHESWYKILQRAKVEDTQDTSATVQFKLPFMRRSVEKAFQNSDFLITGLPRSGTSLLCNLLHKAANTVVVNEPSEVFAAIERDPQCLSLKLLYRKLRSDILLGKAIHNKVNERGEVTEDTRFDNEYRQYLPEVSTANFRLGTKNPLAYLSRLRVLRDALPNMPKIVVLRHPINVISSWKASFEHLRDVDLNVIPFASQDDLLLDSAQKSHLKVINGESNLAVKRALYFRYLAHMISRDKSHLHIIRYEDLLDNPQTIMNGISDLIGSQRLSKNVLKAVRAPSKNKVGAIDSQDKDAIFSICGDFMREWGYEEG